MTRLMLWRSLFAVLTFGLLVVQAGELTEADKRKEFAKAYSSTKPEERVAAVQMLKDGKEQITFDFLAKVAARDPDSPVRLAAYNVLSDWQDTFGNLEQVILDLFREEKIWNTRIAMCQAFPKLKVKTAAVDEAVKFLAKCDYPGDPINVNNNNNNNWNNNNNGGGAGGGAGGGGVGGAYSRPRSAESVAEARKIHSEILAVVNQLTGQSFTAGSKAKEETRKWWALHRDDFLKADAALLVKLRNEARATPADTAAAKGGEPKK